VSKYPDNSLDNVLETFNVNGLRDNRKRELVFNWLVSKKYDCICLQETHCTGVDINRWKSEWKTQGGGASAWLCGSSESNGVAILLSKRFAFDILIVTSFKDIILAVVWVFTHL
jgi:exonuclease III